MQSIPEFIKDLANIILYSISSIVRKDPNIWVVGGWFGQKYNDNSKYFFEYVSQNQPTTTITFVTRSPLALRYIKQKGLRGYLINSPQSIFYMLRASVAIFCQSCETDLKSACFSQSVLKVQLWHGAGIKKILPQESGVKLTSVTDTLDNVLLNTILFFLANHMFGRSFTSRNQFPFRCESWKDYDLICSPSAYATQRFKLLFNVSTSQITETGYPRYDMFENLEYESGLRAISDLKLVQSKGFRMGLFAPTHRGSGHVSVLNVFSPGLELLNDWCAQSRTIIFVKLHFCHQNEEQLFRQFSHIRILSDESIRSDIYAVLPRFDFLITDYSSLFTDFLHLRKPVLFVPFDKRAYEQENGCFSAPYEELVPGPIARTWSEAIPLLNRLGEHRVSESVYQKFVKYNDGQNCKRLYNVINRKLHEKN